MPPESVSVAVIHEGGPPSRAVARLDAADPIETVEDVAAEAEPAVDPECVLADARESVAPVETADDRFAETPVVALVAPGDEPDPLDAIEAGAVEVARGDAPGRDVLPRRACRIARHRRLRRENERLAEFASIVSHDLRNPLNVARGHLELLRDEPAPEHVERLEEALDRMDAIVEDVLALARPDGTVDDLEAVNLESGARRAWRAVEAHDVTMRIEDSATLQADPERLQRLLENLFANAVEHGGERVVVGVSDDGFYVADDGTGFPDGEGDAVFEPGYTADGEGTGLGLAIVRGIATGHGWEVSIDESESGGARVELAGIEFA